MGPTNIHIGTSGWSYMDWKTTFYPKGMLPTSYLSFYSKRFCATEINTSFYHLPRKQTVLNWASQVPPDFRFCTKVSRYITHLKQLNDPAETLPKFFEVFELMKDKLGPILFQLPATVLFQEKKAHHFFETLCMLYPGYSFALETRHGSWQTEPALRLLRAHEISLVVAESGNRWPSSEIITSKDIYVRFHGPDGSYGTSYSEEMLRRYAIKFSNWSLDGHILWIFFNNDMNGHAVKNAEKLISLLANITSNDLAERMDLP